MRGEDTACGSRFPMNSKNSKNSTNQEHRTVSRYEPLPPENGAIGLSFSGLRTTNLELRTCWAPTNHELGFGTRYLRLVTGFFYRHARMMAASAVARKRTHGTGCARTVSQKPSRCCIFSSCMSSSCTKTRTDSAHPPVRSASSATCLPSHTSVTQLTCLARARGGLATAPTAPPTFQRH